MTLSLGCTPVSPYRDNGNSASPPLNCAPSTAADGNRRGTVHTSCARLIKETFTEATSADKESKAGYTLYFVEFDDQGWLHHPELATAVIDEVREKIYSIAQKNAQDGLSQLNIITFAHGWKHSAKSDDTNVRQFRLLLRSIALRERLSSGIMAEQKKVPPAEIVGIYLGWRGASVTAPVFSELSFWDRKKAATQVAQGSVREFLARLDTISDTANKDWYDKQLLESMPSIHPTAQTKTDDNSAGPAQRKPVRTLFIGHSFGGHILFTAFSGGVLRDIVEFQERYKQCTLASGDKCAQLPLRRQGDMLILLNPAIEGISYEPLHAAAGQLRSYPRYVAPVFVSITSNADSALSRWFRVGRFLSTIFEEYPDDPDRAALQQEANKSALGGIDRYLTHSLCTKNSTLPDCRRQPHSEDSTCGRWNEMEENERINKEAESNPSLRKAWLEDANDKDTAFSDAVRRFCGDVRLIAHRSTPKYSPIWNVITDKHLISEHNDIARPEFTAVIRQIYSDTAEAAYADPKTTPGVKK